MKNVDKFSGSAGTATLIPYDSATPACLAAYYLDCRGQTPFWHIFILSIVHLRPIEGLQEAILIGPEMTHELLLYALDPNEKPEIDTRATWVSLRPLNYVQQVKLPDDDAALRLVEMCAIAVVNGHLWAEPPLSHQVEPWKSTVNEWVSFLRNDPKFPGPGKSELMP